MPHAIALTVNGVQHDLTVQPGMLLVECIRDQLDLTGTHVACDSSQCGACTVLLDRTAVKSCTVLALQADGATILTVEGLAQNESLHPVQQGFLEECGLQCGFCTPGMLLSAVSLLERNPQPTEAEIRRAIVGNLCRCTGYSSIIKSIQWASRRISELTTSGPKS
jgi:carbon-monoxide dehydrogenase small subunit